MHIPRLITTLYTISVLTGVVVLGRPTNPTTKSTKGYHGEEGARAPRPYEIWDIDPQKAWKPRTRPDLGLSEEAYEARHQRVVDGALRLTRRQSYAYYDCLEWKRRWWPTAVIAAKDDPKYVEFKEECLEIARAERDEEGEGLGELAPGSLQLEDHQQQQSTAEKGNNNNNNNVNPVIEGISRSLARLGVVGGGGKDHQRPNSITTTPGLSGLAGRLKNLQQLGVPDGSVLLPVNRFVAP
ncbi:MAG: hypothetical protein M1816_007754 [Peltula sp. TS41687]|nr:MAG: hypothetical protein M1816_007754 [Peltula sp. TS41687]